MMNNSRKTLKTQKSLKYLQSDCRGTMTSWTFYKEKVRVKSLWFFEKSRNEEVITIRVFFKSLERQS